MTQRRPHRDVLQVQVLVVHRVAQLADLLLDLGDLPGAELRGGVSAGRAPSLLRVLLRLLVLVLVLVQLQEPDHELQTRAVQVHVQPVPTQNVHEGCRAESEVLRGGGLMVSSVGQ